MPKSALDVRFPAAGLNKRMAVQSQPPFTSPDLLNVRPEETFSGRERGGSRPGMAKAFTNQLGSGNPVRLVNSVREVYSTSGVNTYDEFDGTALSDSWSAMPWAGAGVTSGRFLPSSLNQLTGGVPTTVNSSFVKSLATIPPAEAAYGAIEAAVKALIDLDSTQSTTITLQAHPFAVGSLGLRGRYWLFARMNDSAPDISDDGIYLLVYNSSQASETQVGFSLGVMVGGSLLATYAPVSLSAQPSTVPYPIQMSVSASDVVTVTFNGTVVLTQDVSSHSIPAGRRIGFGVQSYYISTNTIQTTADSFAVSYVAASTDLTTLNRKRLVASSNGLLYRETTPMTMAAVGTMNSLDLASDRLIESSERLGTLFIADNGIRDQGTDGTISGQGGSTGAYTCTFDDGGGQDWDDVADVGDIVWLYNASNAANIRFARITAINGGGTTISLISTELSSGLGAFVNEAGTVSYRVLRSLKQYAAATDTLSIWLASSGGEIPYGCSLVAKHLDRMYLAGAIDSPHVWYASRQGDPYDFDYGDPSTDLQRAIASSNSDTGDFGEPITALIPFHDDYLIFGARSSMWILRGDPAQGGRIDNMSRITGCLSARSWCYAPGGELFVLGSDGVYVFQVGTGGFSESTRNGSFSRDRIPDELKNIDPALFTVTMGYDVNDRGIHIFVTPVASTAGQRHWWIDLETSGFFPLTLPTTKEATASHYYTADNPSDNAMMLGGRDGYIRKFSKAATTDDGTAFIDDSYVVMGPFQTGQPGVTDGYIDEIIATPSLASGDVTWSLHVGKTAESALAASASATGTFAAGLNRSARPRRRGQSAFLKFTGQTEPWSIEQLAMTRGAMGRLRVG